MNRSHGMILALTLVAASAGAQTVVNPTQLQFTASVDHAGTIAGTSPAVALVDHYDVTVITISGPTTTVFTQGLGKPTPDATNTITVPVSMLPPFATLSKNTLFAATVSAVNATAATASGPSNPFAWLGPARAPGTPVLK